jgi:hypothetical protein
MVRQFREWCRCPLYRLALRRLVGQDGAVRWVSEAVLLAAIGLFLGFIAPFGMAADQILP